MLEWIFEGRGRGLRGWLVLQENSVLFMCCRNYRSLEIQGRWIISHQAEEKEDDGTNRPLTSSQGTDPLRAGR